MPIIAYYCMPYLAYIIMNSKILNLRSLGDETRLRIINLLVKSGEMLCVCELMYALKLPQYSVSKALIILKNAGLISSEKKGIWVYYKLNNNTAENKKIINFLSNYLNDGIFLIDEKKLNKRLLLRENNKCTVGSIPEKDLRKMIEQKMES
jgi:ArsR family transcriptional regulator, arsenate/arsenite/antimonite-responsive transcriptional repressor